MKILDAVLQSSKPLIFTDLSTFYKKLKEFTFGIGDKSSTIYATLQYLFRTRADQMTKKYKDKLSEVCERSVEDMEVQLKSYTETLSSFCETR